MQCSEQYSISLKKKWRTEDGENDICIRTASAARIIDRQWSEHSISLPFFHTKKINEIGNKKALVSYVSEK
jgi:hypothetical protein